MDVIIETPKGSNIKYAWDEKQSKYRAKKLLGRGLTFPYDFGFIPGTLGEDGDPLDVMVISEASAYPGVVVDVRIIGCIRVKQSRDHPLIRNDRYLGIPIFSREYEPIKDIGIFPDYLLQEIISFLRDYVEAGGKKIIIEGLINAEDAMKEIMAQTVS